MHWQAILIAEAAHRVVRFPHGDQSARTLHSRAVTELVEKSALAFAILAHMISHIL
jgi:hypothetical protein